MLLVWKAQMGHRPDSRLLFRGHILHPVRLSCSFPWSNERDRVKSWHREREAGRGSSPAVFHLSAHIKQRYPSHPLPPPLHFLSLWTGGCGFTSDRESSKKCESGEKSWRPAIFKDNSTRKSESETLPLFWTLSLTLLPVLMTNGRSQGSLIHPAATHTLQQPTCTLHIPLVY